jgi:hypothetical protein
VKRESPQRYPYFDVVMGLAWSNNPESYVSASVATGRASHARQIKGDGPDRKGYLGPLSWRMSVALTSSPRKTHLLLNFNQSLGMGIKGRGRLCLRDLDLALETSEQCSDQDP